MSGCILGTAVVEAVVVRTGTLEGESPLLVVDLMALLCELHPVLEPLARRPERGRRIKEDRHDRGFGEEKTKLGNSRVIDEEVQSRGERERRTTGKKEHKGMREGFQYSPEHDP